MNDKWINEKISYKTHALIYLILFRLWFLTHKMNDSVWIVFKFKSVWNPLKYIYVLLVWIREKENTTAITF